jgi:hypothetical protein
MSLHSATSWGAFSKTQVIPAFAVADRRYPVVPWRMPYAMWHGTPVTKGPERYSDDHPAFDNYDALWRERHGRDRT